MTDEMLVDVATCRRVAALSAFGLADNVIADALLLSALAMEQIRASSEFKVAYAEKSSERLDRLQAMEEGWDGVEQVGIEKVLDALKYNVDPRFALQAAAIANRAIRKGGTAQTAKVLDATSTGRVVILSLNQKFVQNITVNEQVANLDIQPADMTQVPRRQADIPSPKRVSELLQIPKNAAMEIVGSEGDGQFAGLLDRHGISPELFDE